MVPGFVGFLLAWDETDPGSKGAGVDSAAEGVVGGRGMGRWPP
jgi:hypothetical protein